MASKLVVLLFLWCIIYRMERSESGTISTMPDILDDTSTKIPPNQAYTSNSASDEPGDHNTKHSTSVEDTSKLDSKGLEVLHTATPYVPSFTDNEVLAHLDSKMYDFNITYTDFLPPYMFYNRTHIDIQDNIVRQVVDKFRTLCPKTELCKTASGQDGTVNDIESSYYDYNTKSCCRECRCDTNCGTECCPDKPDMYLNKTERPEKVAECILAQYKPYSFRRENSYYFRMVTKCPQSYLNAFVQEQCQHDVIDFDFKSGLTGFMPATSIASNRTYKNEYCAACHNESLSDLVYWEVKLGCAYDIALFISSETDIKTALNARDDCNILFKYPEYEQDVVEVCGELLVDRCNVTGRWDKYDALIETACLSYTSVYRVSLGEMGYKNIHCYLCNGHNESDIAKVCFDQQAVYPTPVRSSFVALLDFNNLESTVEQDEQMEETCPIHSIYDASRDICLALHCAAGMKLSEAKCMPIYQAVESRNSIVFDVTLVLEPIEEEQEEKFPTPLDMMHSVVVTEVNIRLGAMPSAMMSICSAQSFIRLHESIESIIRKFNYSQTPFSYRDIGQFGIRLNIEAYYVANMSKTTEELERIVDDTFMFGSHHAAFLDMEKSLLVSNTSADYRLKYMDSQSWFDNGIAIMSGNDVYIEGTFPIVTATSSCKSSFSTQLKPFCPKLRLTSKEYKLTDNMTRVFIPHINSYINISSVMFDVKGESILVCVSDYITLVQNYKLSSGNNNYSVGSIYTPLAIVTLVCMAMSLIALMITFAIYCLFSKLRSVPGKNNMALVVSLFITHLFSLLNMCVNIKVSWLCSAVGIILHLSLVSSFAWMFVCTFHMLKVFVAIERSSAGSTTKLFVRYLCFTEAFSVAVVIITVSVSYITTESSSIGYGGHRCYIRDPAMILYAVAIPIGVVVVANLFMFFYVVFKISTLPDMRKNSTSERNNITIFAKLSTITGLTWIFGFIYQFSNVQAFAYIFTVLNASQGIFIMFSFVINKRVLEMFRRMKSAESSQFQSMDTRTRATKASESVTHHT